MAYRQGSLPLLSAGEFEAFSRLGANKKPRRKSLRGYSDIDKAD
jgi:hypothetical protein